MAALSENAIRDRVGARSLERGWRYYRQGNIHDARQQGNVLKARCHGSDENDYRIEVRLDGSRIVEGRCTCPVGAGGMCKHVAALLLNWLERPDEFQQVEGIESTLARRSKSELIDLIRTLLEADPNLEDVVESALPIEADEPSVSLAAVRQRISRVFETSGDSPAGAAQIAAAIEAQRTYADRRLKSGDVQNAVSICRGILGAVTAHYDMEADSSGEIAHAVHETTGLLLQCFTRLDEPDALRLEILQDLLKLLQFDVGMGGIGLADEVPELIARHSTPGERRQIVEWVRKLTPPPKGGDMFEAWRRECWGALIADLIGDEMEDEEYIEHCLEFGLAAARVARLLELERYEEAFEAAEEIDDSQLPDMAELFLKFGREEDALDLMRSRAADSPAAATWLIDYHEERGEWDEALNWRRRQFEKQPDLFHYRAVRRAAEKAGQWPQLREESLQIVEHSADLPSRIRILLDEGQVDRVLELLDQARIKRAVDSALLEEVARAAERSHPEQAIELYLGIAERLIQSRKPGNYAAACHLLDSARHVYESTGRSEDWNRRIATIASRTSRLRAFQRQLRRAKLLP